MSLNVLESSSGVIHLAEDALLAAEVRLREARKMYEDDRCSRLLELVQRERRSFQACVIAMEPYLPADDRAYWRRQAGGLLQEELHEALHSD